jgi:hypothetical protein
MKKILLFALCATAGAAQTFNVVEATIPQMRTAMEKGRVTSHQLAALRPIRIGLLPNFGREFDSRLALVRLERRD